MSAVRLGPVMKAMYLLVDGLTRWKSACFPFRMFPVAMTAMWMEVREETSRCSTALWSWTS